MKVRNIVIYNHNPVENRYEYDHGDKCKQCENLLQDIFDEAQM